MVYTLFIGFLRRPLSNRDQVGRNSGTAIETAFAERGLP